MFPNEMIQSTVSFFTCCYEADWEYLLIDGRLNQLIQRFDYPFASKNLVINNVDDKEKVKKCALQAVNNGVIDNFFFSENYADEVLSKFVIKRKNFKLDGFNGYWFSIAPLTSIYLCNSDYILYSTADCQLNENYSFNWIDEGICKLNDDKIFIVTPFWKHFNSKAETFLDEDEHCYYDYGFSDQIYLAKTRELKSTNFNEYNVRSEIFPVYGGNHFERRVFSYMNNHSLMRCIFKDVVYEHGLLIKPGYVRKIGSSYIMNKLKYTIARIKKRLRKKNIMRAFLYQ